MAQFKRFNASENDNYDTSAVYPSGTLTWDPDNGLRLHDGNTNGGVAIGGGGSLTAVDTNIEIKVSDANENYYTIRQTIDDNNSNNYASTELNYEQFSIRTDQQNNGGYEWRFDSNGEFRVPGNINTYDNDIEIRAMNAGNAGNITIKTVSHINNIHYSQIQLNQGGINITTDMDVTSGGKSFEFRDTGILVLPSGGDIHNSSGNSVISNQSLNTNSTVTFGNVSSTGTITSSGNVNSTAFAVVGNGAVSNVALGFFPTGDTPAEMAIRDYSTANSSIYFDTTIGSANTGGQFQFRGSNAFTVYAKITSHGVIQPTMPAFRVYGNAVTNVNTTTNTTGRLNGNNWAVDYNQGSYLNSTTGVFTAPVAGLYQVNLVARVSSNDGPASSIRVIKNEDTTPLTQVYWEVPTNAQVNHFGVSTVSKLAVGDTLTLKVTTGNVTFDVNDNWSVAFLG
jgi:hypothetical protein